MQDYRKLVVWQKAHKLVLLIYQITRSFPKEERFNLTSQVRRSTTSIPTNIVEGCGKYTQSDFANYLQVALGSTQETEYLCFLSRELEYVDDKKYKIVSQDIGAVKAMLISLIQKLRN
ncbi:four helix bundle protein [Pseudochryseolinea flava]|uniref:Four helix bundle protein n=1 Tax=Pseudochryseolinea flava TaxID=2059302 RepID=A0A364Y652_9BACT|nr:four helix bundle protein [Pseudochryseolinea flava]RAW01715.1 four helix bundle protein [Pseudochryseolinea flava]